MKQSVSVMLTADFFKNGNKNCCILFHVGTEETTAAPSEETTAAPPGKSSNKMQREHYQHQ